MRNVTREWDQVSTEPVNNEKQGGLYEGTCQYDASAQGRGDQLMKPINT